MRKIIPSLIMAISLLIAPSIASAQSIFDKSCEGVPSDAALCADKDSGENPLTGSDGLFVQILSIINLLVGVAAVIMIILGGIQYMISTGDPSKVNTAKNTIMFAVIGVIIALFAQILVLFVVRRL